MHDSLLSPFGIKTDWHREDRLAGIVLLMIWLNDERWYSISISILMGTLSYMLVDKCFQCILHVRKDVDGFGQLSLTGPALTPRESDTVVRLIVDDGRIVDTGKSFDFSRFIERSPHATRTRRV